MKPFCLFAACLLAPRFAVAVTAAAERFNTSPATYSLPGTTPRPDSLIPGYLVWLLKALMYHRPVTGCCSPTRRDKLKKIQTGACRVRLISLSFSLSLSLSLSQSGTNGPRVDNLKKVNIKRAAAGRKQYIAIE